MEIIMQINLCFIFNFKPNFMLGEFFTLFLILVIKLDLRHNFADVEELCITAK